MYNIKEKINFDKLYFYLILLFALTLPLSRAAVSLFTIILPLIWFFEGEFRRKYKQIRENKTLFSLIIFIFVSLSSILWTNNYQDTRIPIKMLSYLILVFVIATSLNKEYITKVISIFLIGMFISEVIAYGVFFEIWHFGHATPQNPSPFMMHIDYSVFMAFTSILLLNRIVSSKYKIKEKIFFAIFFTTVTGNLFLATGRTGQVALIFAIIIMSIIHFRLSIKSILASIILISTIYTTAYNISDSFQLRTAQALNDVKNIANKNLNTSWGIRVAYWIVTYNILKENPFGVGLGDTKDAIKKELTNERYNKIISQETRNYMAKHHPHNEYLLILLQSGLIGLMAFLYFIYNFLMQYIEDKEIKELSILFFTVYLVGSLAEPLLIKQFTAVLFVLFVGLFSNIQKNIYTTNKI